MLMINANRHLEANFGVFGLAPNWIGVRLSRYGKGRSPATRQKFKNGVGNECFDQIMGRPAALP
jgi:hypothetical protein